MYNTSSFIRRSKSTQIWRIIIDYFICFYLQIVTVELHRGWNSRLGFSLQSDATTKSITFISAIYTDSVAARDGRLKVGDQLLMVSSFILLMCVYYEYFLCDLKIFHKKLLNHFQISLFLVYLCIWQSTLQRIKYY